MMPRLSGRRRRMGQTAALVLLLAHAPLMKAIECYTATGYECARLYSSCGAGLVTSVRAS